VATLNRKTVSDIGIASTIVDAAMEFARGRPKSGAMLLGAAALSRRVPGLGFAVSALLRVYRRLR
jgi:hypothetical protein